MSFVRAFYKKDYLIIFLFFLILFALYGASLKDYYLSDDFIFLKSSRDLIDSGNINQIFLKSPIGDFFRPLTDLSFIIDYKIWGTNHFGYHLTNILLHFINAVFMFYLVKLLFKSKLAAILASLFFITYPGFHENITWISGRSDLIPTFFILLTSFLFVKYLKNNKLLFYLFSILTFALALLGKESAITFIGVLFIIYIFFFLKKYKLKKILIFSPYIIVLFLYFFIRKIALGSFLAGYSLFGKSVSLSLGLSDIKTFLGLPLSLIKYSYNQSFLNVFLPRFIKFINYIHWDILLFLLGIILILVYMFIYKKYQRQLWHKLVFSYILMLVLAFPMITLFKYLSHDLQNTRFLYLPSIAFFMFLGFILASFLKILKTKQTIFVILFIIFLIFLSNILLLKFNYQPWENAARLTQNFKVSLSSNEQKLFGEDKSVNFYFENVPDNLNGAYVFRRGIGELINLVFIDKKTVIHQSGRDFSPDFNDCNFENLEQKNNFLFTWDNKSQRLIDQSVKIDDWLNLSQIQKANIEKLNASQLNLNADNLRYWQIGSNLKIEKVESGYNIKSSDKNNYLISPRLDLPALAIKNIVIEYSSIEQGSYGSLFWATKKYPYFDEYQRHIIFPIEKGSTVVDIEVCRYVSWLASDDLEMLRIDLINEPADFQLKNIEVY